MSVSAAKVTDSGQNSARPRSLLGVRLLQCAPVLLPLIVLVGTGLRGLDFGLHWDERPWQIGPVKHMVQAHTFLPGYYNYPSFDYWLNLLVLAPDAAGSRIAGDNLREHLLYTLDSHAYLLRLRAAYLLITSLTLAYRSSHTDSVLRARRNIAAQEAAQKTGPATPPLPTGQTAPAPATGGAAVPVPGTQAPGPATQTANPPSKSDASKSPAPFLKPEVFFSSTTALPEKHQSS